MAKLNELTEKTKKVIHIMVTSMCDRNCRYCCNKQYDLNDIPYVTDSELRDAEVVCITGGEPFEYSNPCAIAKRLKDRYPNIKNVYVYTNAMELSDYLFKEERKINSIDGLNISIKCPNDALVFKTILKTHPEVIKLKSNLVYVFNNLYNEEPEHFTVVKREWQKEFVAADDSIFRKL